MNLATANEYVQEIVRLHAEISRLRLTDAEREAVQRAMASIADTLDYASQQAAADYATLRVLLERTSGTHATPAQGSVQGR